MLKMAQKLEMRSSWYSKLPFVTRKRPPINGLLLCVISVFVLIALSRLYSSGEFDSTAASSRPNIYSSYRKLREQAVNDYLELRDFGANRVNDYGLCGKERENDVPCYSLSANLLAGFGDGEEFDRHCEVSRNEHRCLIRPPKEYKIPLTWPSGRDVIWSGNVKISKDQFLSSGSKMKRLMLLEENQIAFHSNDGTTVDGVKDYSLQIAKMIGLRSDDEFHEAGVRNVLDIGCGFGSFGAHLLSLKLMAVCMAAYESTGSQVQLALERGLPAIIGNFVSRQLPFPSLSYDMVHCARCGIFWDDKDGMFLIEVDRVLKPGGYFVVTSPRSRRSRSSLGSRRGDPSNPFQEFIQKLCWNLLSEQEDTFIWQKTTESPCHASRKDVFPLCKGEDGPSYYKPLVKCISGTSSKYWTPIQNRSSSLSSAELQVHGINPREFSQDSESWRYAVRNYWSLLSPLIFSDHPKRPSVEDPIPPYNMVRNVMDMNANYGGLNAALLEAGYSVWVMNVVPVGERNTLPLILDQGFAGAIHNWCEPFPTYPRTYDMLHGKGLLSLVASEKCSFVDLIVEMDRILRPEGWVIFSDKIGVIEKARTLVARLHWEARVVDLQNGADQHLLICQKPFLRSKR